MILYRYASRLTVVSREAKEEARWIGIKLPGRVNLFLLYISDKFHCQ